MAKPSKCLTVVDQYTRECLAIDVAGSIRSKRVIFLLSKLISVEEHRNICEAITVRNSWPPSSWNGLYKRKFEGVLINPGKPWQNGTNESLNGKFRDECL
jgi:putative transposase